MNLYSIYYSQNKENVFNIYVRRKKILIDKIGTFIKKKDELVTKISYKKLNYWLNRGLVISNLFTDTLIDRFIFCRILDVSIDCEKVIQISN